MSLTAITIITNQFTRLHDGDRFGYQNGRFPRRQLETIEATRLSDILIRTTGVTGLQPNIFHAADLSAP